MNKLLAIDLFCGAGGLTEGLKQAGFQVVAGVELDRVAADTYRANHKGHHVYQADIRALCPMEILNDLSLKPGELDLLAGCPPCQGFSTHRTRNKSSSVADARNDLIFEFLRFVKVMLPKTIMMENVPGLAKDPRIDHLKNELAAVGYLIGDDAVAVKDAADYAVPQRRRRMILQVSRLGRISAPETMPPSTVRKAISELPRAGFSGDILHDLPEKRKAKTEELIRLVPKNGGSRADLPIEFWLPCHIRNPGSYRDVYGRMSWDTVSPTITGGCVNPSKGRFLHPEYNRAITLREAAILQTFPPGYHFSLSKGKDFAALMIGNALPPEFIRCHAVEFNKHLARHI